MMSFIRTNKVVVISLTIILVLVVGVFYSTSLQKVYGNDEESIIEVIQSIEGYNHGLIEILEVRDIEDIRIVAFLVNNSPSYIRFERNSKGNYEWSYAEKKDDKSFASFSIKVPSESLDVRLMVITTEENKIAKMELGVNNRIIEQGFRVNERTVTWIPYSTPNEKQYRFTYKYYDENGNPVVEE